MVEPQAMSYVEIRQTILQKIPPEIGITRIEFEGPRLAIYTKKPELLVEQQNIVSDIVREIKKRIVVRSDPSVRLDESVADRQIKEIVPAEASINQIDFDPVLGEVTIEVLKPGLAIGKGGSNLEDIVKKTKWIPNVARAPNTPSTTMTQIRNYLYSKSKERERFLRETGEAIFRTVYTPPGDVRITALGGCREVGRSAFLVRTRESSVLLDCGVNPGTGNPLNGFPRIDTEEFDLSLLDGVIITHAHLDHCGFLPFLMKHGYKGPVYCSLPTQALMVLIQSDYVDVMHKEGRMSPYSMEDVRTSIAQTIPLRYGEVTDISPDIRLTLHNAGHILGSSVVHLHIGKGLHNIVYTGDFKYGLTSLLEPAAVQFPRVETLIMESTYGGVEDIMPSRVETEKGFVDICNSTLKEGKVIVPVPAVGRAQEIMMVINKYMKTGELTEAPVYIEGMINEATSIHMSYPSYLSTEIQDQILHKEENPFESEYFTTVKQPDLRDEIAEGGPCIIIATSGMMEGGPVIEYFKKTGQDPKNSLVFVSYQVNGTLGRRLQAGLTQVQTFNTDGRMEITQVGMKMHTIEGFSGHSDRRQLLAYLKRISPSPKNVMVCHGEEEKCYDLARTVARHQKLDAFAPEILTTTRVA